MRPSRTLALRRERLTPLETDDLRDVAAAGSLTVCGLLDRFTEWQTICYCDTKGADR